MQNLIIKPTTLSIITTYRCTSSCKNCCFQCNPLRKEKLSVENIKKYIKETVEAYKSVKVLVLTGGECFLYKKELSEIIEYAASFNLMTRIVTNGFWAKNYNVAYKKISELVNSGLKEINFSTGDDHLEFVPIDTIINATLAALRHNIITVINVESAQDRKFNSKLLMENHLLTDYIRTGQLKIINGIWMPFTQSTAKSMEESKSNSDSIIIFDTNRRCTNIFNTITIDPNSRMIACCGLTSKYIKHLDLGNVNNHPIKELYENQFNDFLKIWIATEGPHKIMNFISNYIDITDFNYKKSHACFVCEKIFNNKIYLDILQKEYREIYSNTIMKHLFNIKQLNYEKAE